LPVSKLEAKMADMTLDNALHAACNPALPEAGDVWDGVVN